MEKVYWPIIWIIFFAGIIYVNSAISPNDRSPGMFYHFLYKRELFVIHCTCCIWAVHFHFSKHCNIPIGKVLWVATVRTYAFDMLNESETRRTIPFHFQTCIFVPIQTHITLNQHRQHAQCRSAALFVGFICYCVLHTHDICTCC